MTYQATYEAWKNNPYFDEAFREELALLTDEKEIEDRFYTDLSFGTAGLRGIIGAGSNRINLYVVRKATQGYANYLKETSESPSCVIAYDNRRMSIEFAQETACVMAANGVKTYLFDALRSTPELSFAIRHLKTTGGVVITASHNPPAYNGYKVYGSDGAQLIPVEADKVTEAVNAVTSFETIKFMPFEEAKEKNLVSMIGEEIDRAFLTAVKRQIVRPDAYKMPLKISFSPLHGTGGMIVERLMKELSVGDVHFVPEQMVVDTEFSTCQKPNPEEMQAFDVSREYGELIGAELLIATDPDADRVGVVVRDRQGVYQALNGNQIGALLTYYILSSKHTLPMNAVMVKTVVTSDLGPKIAKDFGVDSLETLTGFKFIGEKIKQFETTGKQHFVLGYEESYGYLVGTHARDKDAVVATMLVIEMAKYYKSVGQNLLDVLEKLYQQYGYHVEHMISKTLPGKSGMEMIGHIMDAFRDKATQAFKPYDLVVLDDFEKQLSKNLNTGQETTLDFPESNVLKYYMADQSWFAVRPSGTEPKIKFYVSVIKSSQEEATKAIKDLERDILGFIDTIINE